MTALALAIGLTSTAGAGDSHTLTYSGRERTYLVHRPDGLSRAHAVPLVIMLHGGFGSGAQAEKRYHWDAEADRGGFVVAYPDGVRRAWNAGGKCCGQPNRDNVDDVGFLTRLIETVSRDENIDARRVYLTGISNGAAMSYRYACEGRFPVAAIGSISGALSYPCAKPHAASVMEIHGLKDTRIPFAGGHGNGVASDVSWEAAEQTMEAFRRADDCAPASITRNGVVETRTSACAHGRAVVLITIADAGHQWPGGETQRGVFTWLLRLDPPSQALDATALLWRFFRDHPAD